MDKIYEVYLVSDSTGETLDRIFLALQAQFLTSFNKFFLSLILLKFINNN